MIIDSQPLTVAVLAALLFGESIGSVGAAGLVLGVIGLLLLEVILSGNNQFLYLFSCEWLGLALSSLWKLGMIINRILIDSSLACVCALTKSKDVVKNMIPQTNFRYQKFKILS